MPIIDCFAGEIIAVAMDNNMKKELCIRALKNVYELRIGSVQLHRHKNCYRISFNQTKAAWGQKINMTQKSSKSRSLNSMKMAKA